MQAENKNSKSGKAIFPALLGILIVLIIVAAVMLFMVLSLKKD